VLVADAIVRQKGTIQARDLSELQLAGCLFRYGWQSNRNLIPLVLHAADNPQYQLISIGDHAQFLIGCVGGPQIAAVNHADQIIFFETSQSSTRV